MTENAPVEELKAIAHPIRFRVLQALRDGELNVGEIEQATEIGQPALSQQLSVLRKAGLVETRKEAKLVYYRLAAERMAAVAGAVTGLMEGEDRGPSMSRTPSPGAANFARLF